jgi:hypothetical protein
MAHNKTARNFNTLNSRVTTDSVLNSAHNERSACTINTHANEIWGVPVPSDPSDVSSLYAANIQKYTLETLVNDRSVSNGYQTWLATSNKDAATAYLDQASFLLDWISPKYDGRNSSLEFVGSTTSYAVLLYTRQDGETVWKQVGITDFCDWHFDYVTGILTLNGSSTAHGPIDEDTQFAITGWRYVGPKGVAGLAEGEAVEGSVLFINSSGLIGQDPTRFFYDESNRRLGLGTDEPATRLHVAPTASSSSAVTISALEYQTGDLLRNVDSDGVPMSRFDAAGTLKRDSVGVPFVQHGDGTDANTNPRIVASSPIGSGVDLKMEGANRIVFNPGYGVRFTKSVVEWTQGISWDLSGQSMSVSYAVDIALRTGANNIAALDAGADKSTVIRAYGGNRSVEVRGFADQSVPFMAWTDTTATRMQLGHLGDLTFSPASGGFGLRAANLAPAAIPSAGATNVGGIIFDTEDERFKGSNGTAWTSFPSLDGGGGTPGTLALFVDDSSLGDSIVAQTDGETVYVDGALEAYAKNFRIDHPEDPETSDLVYGCLEGPENGAYGRGTAKGRGTVRVDLQPEWSKLVGAGYTVLPVPRGDYRVFVVDQDESGFTVARGGWFFPRMRTFECDYLVIGSRRGAPLETKQPKRARRMRQ